jgi:hypothetical protein
MIADIMTKMLPKPRFIELREKLNVISRATFDKRDSIADPIAHHVRAIIAIDAAARTTAHPIKEAVKILREDALGSEIKVEKTGTRLNIKSSRA